MEDLVINAWWLDQNCLVRLMYLIESGEKYRIHDRYWIYPPPKEGDWESNFWDFFSGKIMI